MNRYDGDIIITDPCYIFSEENSDTINLCEAFHELFNKIDFGEKSIDQCEIDRCLNEIAVHESFLGKPNDYDDNMRNAFIRSLKRRLVELHKPENFVYGDFREPYCNFLSEIGISKCMYGSTLYGDWSCTVFDTDTKQKLGKFCADSGTYGVFLLEEVLKIAPKFDYHVTRPHTATVIKDFHGEIKVEIDNDNVKIIGSGNINFTSVQTGL